MSNWGRSDGVSPFQKVSWEQAQREQEMQERLNRREQETKDIERRRKEHAQTLGLRTESPPAPNIMGRKVNVLAHCHFWTLYSCHAPRPQSWDRFYGTTLVYGVVSGIRTFPPVVGWPCLFLVWLTQCERMVDNAYYDADAPRTIGGQEDHIILPKLFWERLSADQQHEMAQRPFHEWVYAITNDGPLLPASLWPAPPAPIAVPAPVVPAPVVTSPPPTNLTIVLTILQKRRFGTVKPTTTNTPPTKEAPMAAPVNKPEDTTAPETAREVLRRKIQTPTDLGSTVAGGIADGTASAILGTVAKRLIPKVPMLNMLLSDPEKQARYGGLLVGALGYVLIHFDALPEALSWLRLPIMHGLRGGVTGVVNLHSLSIFEAVTEARKDLKDMNIDVDKL